MVQLVDLYPSCTLEAGQPPVSDQPLIQVAPVQGQIQQQIDRLRCFQFRIQLVIVPNS